MPPSGEHIAGWEHETDQLVVSIVVVVMVEIEDDINRGVAEEEKCCKQG